MSTSTAAPLETDPPTILSADIGPMPRPMPQGMLDEMPSVTALFSNGTRERLFTYFPDEISFVPGDFVGLTKAQAMELRRQRDVSYLRELN